MLPMSNFPDFDRAKEPCQRFYKRSNEVWALKRRR